MSDFDTRYRFEAVNLAGFFVRHRFGEGVLSRLDEHVGDFVFTVEHREQGRVGIRSSNYPDRYLRHRDFRLHLDERPDDREDLFFPDSTFWLRRGLADEAGISFESVNFPGRYIRHRDVGLWLEAAEAEGDHLFRADATFLRRVAPVIPD